MDENHLKIADTSKPIIQAEIKIGKFEIIDGNHRFEKALREGKKTIDFLHNLQSGSKVALEGYGKI